MTKTTTALITRDYNGTPFVFREDGYFNMTRAAQHFGKRLDHFWHSPDIRAYCCEMALPLNLYSPDSGDFSYGLAQVKMGRNGGTFGHPKIAVRFAQWLDPRFAVWCDMMIEDILAGRAELKITKPEQSAVLQMPMPDNLALPLMPYPGQLYSLASLPLSHLFH